MGTARMGTTHMGTTGSLPYLPKKHKLLSWFICLLVLVLTMLIMLLSWTPLSSQVVEGVQGRYFLPILPLALMTLPNGYVRVGGGSPGSATGYQAEQIERILVTGYAIANGFVLYGILATL
jgi:TRAP-type C4-dicarboxylate transport system permease small subunit